MEAELSKFSFNGLASLATPGRVHNSLALPWQHPDVFGSAEPSWLYACRRQFYLFFVFAFSKPVPLSAGYPLQKSFYQLFKMRKLTS
jgi:hypothetical protein